MVQKNWQKLKILKLTELLRQETDEEHPLTTKEICARMENMGIPCERRTLSEDVTLLNETGIEVLWKRTGKQKGYYIEDRSFSVPELKILIDAVQAASFITEKKTAEFIDKIADLGGTHKAEILKSNIVRFNTRKHSNESVYYNVDAIEDALRKRKKLAFRYFDLDADGGKVYRKNGDYYLTEPIALVFNEDNYYAVVYSSKYNDTANYRVDRMDGAEVRNENISDEAVKLRRSVWKYTERAVKMYGGENCKVKLEFDKKLIGAVYDRFGEKVKMKETGDKITAAVNVQLSPTFWGWLFQFGKQMRIVAPDTAIEEYRARAKEILEDIIT